MEPEATNRESFRTLFDAHYNEIQAYCLRRLPSAESNDATADVFAIAWSKFDEAPEYSFRRAWLYGIARNVIRRSYRTRSRRARLDRKLRGLGQAHMPAPEVEVVRRSEDEALIRALATLDETDQEILRLRIWEELTANEIAGIVSMSAAAVEKRISRGFLRLARAAQKVDRQRPMAREVHDE